MTDGDRTEADTSPGSAAAPETVTAIIPSCDAEVARGTAAAAVGSGSPVVINVEAAAAKVVDTSRGGPPVNEVDRLAGNSATPCTVGTPAAGDGRTETAAVVGRGAIGTG